MSLDKARAALVQAYIDAGLNLPTVYENRPEEPPANPWAIFTFIPNNPEVVTLGKVVSDHPVTVAGMSYLVSQGLLTETEKNEILGGD